MNIPLTYEIKCKGVSVDLSFGCGVIIEVDGEEQKPSTNYQVEMNFKMSVDKFEEFTKDMSRLVEKYGEKRVLICEEKSHVFDKKTVERFENFTCACGRETGQRGKGGLAILPGGGKIV